MEKYFYGVWIILGFLQILMGTKYPRLAFSSEIDMRKSNQAPSESLPQWPNETLIPLSKSGKPVTSLPVRYPRHFLKQSLTGSITGNSEDGRIHFKASSPIAWVESPTTLAPPTNGAIADFRDFQGCMVYQDLSGLSLCFNVMPDVSSIGVNPKEMNLKGIEKFVMNQLNEQPETAQCSYAVREVNFQNAVRDYNRVRLYYTAMAEPDNDCDFGDQTFEIKVHFQSNK